MRVGVDFGLQKTEYTTKNLILFSFDISETQLTALSSGHCNNMIASNAWLKRIALSSAAIHSLSKHNLFTNVGIHSTVAFRF
jgi:hypothetical protein